MYLSGIHHIKEFREFQENKTQSFLSTHVVKNRCIHWAKLLTSSVVSSGYLQKTWIDRTHVSYEDFWEVRISNGNEKSNNHQVLFMLVGHFYRRLGGRVFRGKLAVFSRANPARSIPRRRRPSKMERDLEYRLENADTGRRLVVADCLREPCIRHGGDRRSYFIPSIVSQSLKRNHSLE